ncbi:MAG: UvrD-helicase domain-containing protein [Gemmatimonadota bacterium]|nr:UvrD-helicase domain-containing protein [Gemmatimonadota bacterium]MDH4347357.1 UvrD-helicase domain-containing protein [Gemmatimonadota bacterium]MDH5282508.1 UvrD-helicase domain-containing protein [Gemmatimonadota bacterium]
MSDQSARDRILADLDTNFLVEAGAGSGKTTALVGRLLSHVRRGTPVDALAAVTFTRKAANELRERFQLELETATRDPSTPTAERTRAGDALRDLDRAFLGTIHAFCGRLLRERPLDAGLDPGFVELDENAWPEFVEDHWNQWVSECREVDHPDLGTLATLGIEPGSLAGAFHEVVDNPDVDFSGASAPAPDIRGCRERLERLLAEADRLMPRDEPEAGWDALQRTFRRLWYRRRTGDWSDVRAFCAGIAGLSASGSKLTQKCWGTTKAAKESAKALHASFEAWRTGSAQATLTAWREHRYAPVIGILNRAAAEFARRRARTGQLGFADLLVRAAALLREQPDARAELGERFRYLLVDEFQDTDPIQAEVCFLLASPPTEGDDWRRVHPRPGSLFVVGDPKQSIYRFRRADIGIYNLVKERLAACGEVLKLTRNFRSTTAIAALVNARFEEVFPATATPWQAAFQALETDRAPPAGIGVHRLMTPGGNRDEVARANAGLLAAWVDGEIRARRRMPGDFLVLTWWTRDIEPVARALAERNIPAVTTGAPLPQEHELRELVLLLRALADPANPALVAAVLEGLFFGLTPADLYASRKAGARFILTVPPEDGHPASVPLTRLNQWWQQAGTTRPDVFLDQLLDDTGLLAWSACQPLGEARAGALLQLVDAVRRGEDEGVGDLPGMVTLLERLLEREAPDAPLRPGRRDVVRVMNLHKAKGLEGTVVMLGAPVPPPDVPPSRCVRRGEDGSARGSLLVTSGDSILAQAPGWEEDKAAEIAFLGAEHERLHYVAATRAREQLVISDCPDAKKASCWAALAEAAAGAEELAVPADPPPGRAQLRDRTADLRAREALAAASVDRARAPTWRRTSVTRMLREDRAEAETYDLPGSGAGDEARALGTVLHRAIEAAGRGRRGEVLLAFALAAADEEGLSAALKDRLIAQFETMLGLPAIAAMLDRDDVAFELPLVQLMDGAAGRELVEGVIDAACVRDGRWEVVDWKLGGSGMETRSDYRQQVDQYARMLSALSGQQAEGRVVAVALA